MIMVLIHIGMSGLESLFWLCLNLCIMQMSNLTKYVFCCLNYISNHSSRHGLRLKMWNQSSRFDKFCVFSPLREKWIVRSRIKSYSKVSIGHIKVFGGGSILYSFMTAACLFVCCYFGISARIKWTFPWKFNVVPQNFFIQYCHFLE